MKQKVLYALSSLFFILIIAWAIDSFLGKKIHVAVATKDTPASSSAEDDPEVTRVMELLESGYSYLEADKPSEAFDLFTAAILDAERKLAVAPESEEGLVLLSAANLGLCNVAIHGRDSDTAQEHLKKASRILERLASNSEKTIHQILSVSCDIMTGEMAMSQDDIYLASDSYEAAIVKLDLLILRNPETLHYRHDLATCHRQSGRISQERGYLEKAFVSFLRALEIAEVLHKREPENLDYFQDVAAYHTDAGRIAGMRKDFAVAEAHYISALEIRESLAAREPHDPGRQLDLSIAHMNLGILAEDKGSQDSSREHYKRSYDVMKPLVESGKKSSNSDREILEALKSKAEIDLR